MDGSGSERAGRRLPAALVLSLAAHFVLLLLLRDPAPAGPEAEEAAATLVETVRVEETPAPRVRPRPEPDEPDRPAEVARRGPARPRRPLVAPEVPTATPRPSLEPDRPAPVRAPPAPMVPTPRELALSLTLPLDEQGELEARVDDDLDGVLTAGGGEGRCVFRRGGWWCAPGGGGGGGGSERSRALGTGIDLYCW